MGNSLIPYETIIAAKKGEADAMGAILHHFDRLIDMYSRRTFQDEFGNRYEVIDEDIKERIQAKLMYQIIFDFDPYRLPPNTALE